MSERPGEFTTPEGIIYTPDMLIFEDRGLRLGEIKLTWQSSREAPRAEATSFPAKMNKWLTQIKAYCYHLETRLARLYVFYVNGSYGQGGMNPELLSWDICFERRELEENWRMLLNHARHRGMLP